MRGTEHYREAERALRRANESGDVEWAMVNAQMAQVHATLALAAATALAPVAGVQDTRELESSTYEAWQEVAE
ncbi:hypothetical protein STBA_10630 [Streptomyces sp. MP131-18]|nr:hypothetical protein STBA_10630 [Streptomyces sp. MP131-18]